MTEAVVQPIERTNLAIEELAEEIRAENERRHAFYRMLSATDRVLWRLEELNRDGVRTLPAHVRIRMRATLDGLPAACLEVFRDSEVVQEVLDSVFDVQSRLFRHHDPRWSGDEEGVEDDLEALVAVGEGSGG